MQTINCPLCGEDKDKFLTKENEWKIVECRFCGFVFVTPRPDQEYLKKHYQSYLPGGAKEISDWAKMMEGVFGWSLDYINKVCPAKGELLDIGCAHGFFIQDAGSHGWDAYGLDLCQSAVEYAKGKRLKAEYLDIFDKKYPDSSFDVVTMFYVLEHLPEPLRYLKEICRILKPGGLLLVRVPHTTPLVKFLKPLRIPNKLYDAPSHLNDFSPLTLLKMLEKAGFYQAKTFIGGMTYPRKVPQFLVSCFAGILAELLYCLSFGKYLMPGVSKTTVAYRK